MPSNSLIIKINDTINTWDDLTQFLSNNNDEKINLTYKFNNDTHSVNITPVDGKIGIKPSLTKMNIIQKI